MPILTICKGLGTWMKNVRSKTKHNKDHDPRNFTQLIKIPDHNDDNFVLYSHNNHVSDTFENKHVAGQSKKRLKRFDLLITLPRCSKRLLPKIIG